MSFNFSTLNMSNGVRPDNFKTDGFEFVSISEYIGKTLPVIGFFFTNGMHGKQVVIITKDCNVNIPSRYMPTFESLANNPDAVETILAGDMVLTNIKEVIAKNGKDTFAFDFANASTLKAAKK